MKNNFINLQLTANTRKTYTSILGLWETWGGGFDGKAYTNHLKGRGLGNKTINLHLMTISKFCEYETGQKMDYTRLKEKRAEVAPLSQEEVRKLFMNASEPFKVVLRFFLETGCRVSEVAELSRREVGEVPDSFVILGKGGKQRIIVISDQLRSELQSGKIFGKMWSEEGIRRQVRRAARRARIDKWVHPHTLRHTFATDMLDNGVGIEVVSRMLGHANIATTQIYTHVSNERLTREWKEKLRVY